MSYSYTYSDTTSFTVTHAKHIAAKVATDLKRLQRLYGMPNDDKIVDYEKEVVALLKKGYLGTVSYGFRRDNSWIEPTLRYAARDLADDGVDDDPGRIWPGADIRGAVFYSYLTYSASWDRLTGAEKESFQKELPFPRVGASEPGSSGYFSQDRTYSSGGRTLYRATLRSY